MQSSYELRRIITTVSNDAGKNCTRQVIQYVQIHKVKFSFCSAKGRSGNTYSLLESFSFDRVAHTSAIYSLGVTYLDIPKLKHVKQRLFKMLMGPKRPVDRCEAICQHKAKTTKTRHGVQMSNTFHSIFLISVLFKSYN